MRQVAGVWDVVHVLLGCNFVHGLKTLKPKKPKNLFKDYVFPSLIITVS